MGGRVDVESQEHTTGAGPEAASHPIYSRPISIGGWPLPPNGG